MDIKLVDVTLHIDENLPHPDRLQLTEKMRGIDGVVSVAAKDEKPHLMLVEYNPDRTNSSAILACVKAHGVHSELVGL